MKYKITKKWFIRCILIFLLISLLLSSSAVGAERVSPDEKRVLTAAQEQLQKRITFSCRELPMDTVLMQLAEQANIDIIKSPKVKGNVTVKVTDIPLEEVLNHILAAHDCTYIATENMIRVIPIGDATTVRERLITEIYRITYADVEEVAGALRSFVSKQGKVAVNRGTSNLMVTDVESKVKAIDNFIKEIDRITPQILVEVRIYDIKSQDLLDIGVEWSAGRFAIWNVAGEDDEFVNYISDAEEGESLILSQGSSEPHGRGVFNDSTNFTSAAAKGFLEFGILNSNVNIDVLVKLQEEGSSSTLLANPRVLVLDNEIAKFEIINEIPYEETTVTSGVTKITVRFKEIGVKLDVIPHVTREGMLRLNIKPHFSVQAGTVSSNLGMGAPIVDTRRMETIVLIKDGQTVVLGGLRKKDIQTQINKVPFFGDLPILGALFRSEGEKEINSELVVFITPKIIDNPVLTDDEKARLKITEFTAPEPTKTKAERDASKG